MKRKDDILGVGLIKQQPRGYLLGSALYPEEPSAVTKVLKVVRLRSKVPFFTSLSHPTRCCASDTPLVSFIDIQFNFHNNNFRKGPAHGIQAKTGSATSSNLQHATM